MHLFVLRPSPAPTYYNLVYVQVYGLVYVQVYRTYLMLSQQYRQYIVDIIINDNLLQEYIFFAQLNFKVSQSSE